MNEESVNKIINYIQQYPDTPIEQLVANLQNSGYQMNDLKEALHRQGISPIVIPGYVEPDPPPEVPFYAKPAVIITGCIILFLLVVGGSAYFLFGRKPALKKYPGRMQQTLIDPPTPTSGPVIATVTSVPTLISESPNASASSTVDDPFKIFKDTLHDADYKITVDTSEVSPAYENKPAGTSHEVVTAYTKQGLLVRLEQKDQIFIYKDTDTYILSPTVKTYSVVSNGQVVQRSFIPTIVISESEKGNIRWQKKSDSVWSGVWTVDPTNPDAYTTFTITLDNKTHLLNEISSDSNLTKSIQKIKLQYAEIADIDSYMKLSADYKKN